MSITINDSPVTFFRGEDPLRADKLNLAFSERVLRTGDTMLGDLALVRDPTSAMHAVTKQYVDTNYRTALAASFLPLTGGTMQGYIALHANPSAPMHAATKAYVDATVAVPPSMPLPSDAMPIIEGVASPGVLTTYSRADHVHPATAVPVVRNSARLQAQWINAAVVGNDTVWLCYDTPYAGTVNSLLYFTGSGNFTVAVQINDVSVGSMEAISVSLSTPTTITASGATFPIHSKITAVITGSTGAPTDALLSLAVTWS